MATPRERRSRTDGVLEGVRYGVFACIGLRVRIRTVNGALMVQAFHNYPFLLFG